MHYTSGPARATVNSLIVKVKMNILKNGGKMFYNRHHQASTVDHPKMNAFHPSINPIVV